MNKVKALKILVETRDILNQLGIDYWLMCGVLLGALREKDFIGHDEDVDFGINIEELTDKLLSTFAERGYRLSRELGTKDNGLVYSLIKEGVQVDLFFFYKEKDYRWFGAWYPHQEEWKLIKFAHKMKDFTYLTFLGEEFRVPSNTEEYIEEFYGKDWRIENKKWHWASSPRNIIDTDWLTRDKTVCLGMIVKNEAHVLKESLTAIKDSIDYYVIVDTGSTDNTKEVIRETLKDIPGEIVDREWVDFGTNRTEVARLCRDKADYFFTLDADEIAIGKIDKQSLISDYYHIWIYDGYSFRYSVLFNNHFEWKSIGVTHEYWHADKARYADTLNTIRFEHKCVGSRRDYKFADDVKLLRKGLLQEPNNGRYMFYLAQTLKDNGEYEEAITWYKNRINAGGWWEEMAYAQYMIAYCKIRLNASFEEIVDETFKAFHANLKSAEALWELLHYCQYKKFYAFGYYVGKMAQAIPYPTDLLLFVKPAIYKYKIADDLSICAYYVGEYAESYNLSSALLDNPNLPESDKNRISSNKVCAERKLKEKK